MPVEWIEYKGRKILYVDMRNTDHDEMLSLVEKQKNIIDESPEPVLILNDFREAYASNEYMEKAKKYGKEQKDKIKKNAVLGVQGIKKVLFQAYTLFTNSSNTEIFEDIDKAKDFLVS